MTRPSAGWRHVRLFQGLEDLEERWLRTWESKYSRGTLQFKFAMIHWRTQVMTCWSFSSLVILSMNLRCFTKSSKRCMDPWNGLKHPHRHPHFPDTSLLSLMGSLVDSVFSLSFLLKPVRGQLNGFPLGLFNPEEVAWLQPSSSLRLSTASSAMQRTQAWQAREDMSVFEWFSTEYVCFTNMKDVSILGIRAETLLDVQCFPKGSSSNQTG